MEEPVGGLHHLLGGYHVARSGQVATEGRIPVERVGLHLVHVHLHSVGLGERLVERGHLQPHVAGEVDSRFSVGVGECGVFFRLAAGNGEFGVANSRVKRHIHTQCRHIGAHRQRVGIIDGEVFEVDGEKHRVQVLHHIAVGHQVKLIHHHSGCAYRLVNHLRIFLFVFLVTRHHAQQCQHHYNCIYGRLLYFHYYFFDVSLKQLTFRVLSAQKAPHFGPCRGLGAVITIHIKLQIYNNFPKFHSIYPVTFHFYTFLTYILKILLRYHFPGNSSNATICRLAAGHRRHTKKSAPRGSGCLVARHRVNHSIRGGFYK